MEPKQRELATKLGVQTVEVFRDFITSPCNIEDSESLRIYLTSVTSVYLKYTPIEEVCRIFSEHLKTVEELKQ